MSLHLAAAQLAATAASVLFTVAAERQRNQLKYSKTRPTRERKRQKDVGAEPAELGGVPSEASPLPPPQRKKLRGRRRRGRPSLPRKTSPPASLDQPLSVTEDKIPFIKEEIGQMIIDVQIKDEVAIKEELLE